MGIFASIYLFFAQSKRLTCTNEIRVFQRPHKSAAAFLINRLPKASCWILHQSTTPLINRQLGGTELQILRHNRVEAKAKTMDTVHLLFTVQCSSSDIHVHCLMLWYLHSQPNLWPKGTRCPEYGRSRFYTWTFTSYAHAPYTCLTWMCLTRLSINWTIHVKLPVAHLTELRSPDVVT